MGRRQADQPAPRLTNARATGRGMAKPEGQGPLLPTEQVRLSGLRHSIRRPLFLRPHDLGNACHPLRPPGLRRLARYL